MALPPLATPADLAAHLGETIAGGDETRALSLLLAASSLVRAESGSPWVDTDGDLVWDGSDDPRLLLVQEVLVSVTLAAAGRAYVNPEGFQSDTTSLGPYTEGGTRWSDGEPGVYLTEGERRAIALAVGSYRGETSPGLWTLSTTRGDVETETVFLDTVYAGHAELDGEPFPYRAIGDPT